MNVLNKLTTLESAAAEFGFKWERAEQIVAQIRSEITEIETHLQDRDQKKLQEEIGDLLHAVFSLCVFCQFDAAETLSSSVDKFERRFNAVKMLAIENGMNNLQGQTFAELMQLWDKAKILAG